MNKLQRVLAWLIPSMVHQGNQYLYFQSKTGAPFTIIEHDDKLILSGVGPNKPIHRVSEPNDIIKLVSSLAPQVIAHPKFVPGQRSQRIQLN